MKKNASYILFPIFCFPFEVFCLMESIPSAWDWSQCHYCIGNSQFVPTPSDIISESELITDVNSFFWWRIDFWTNYFGVRSQTTLSLFSQKSDFITCLDKPAMLAYSPLHVVSLWWLSCYIVLLSRSLKVIWLPVVTSCVGSRAVTRPFDGCEVSLHVPGKNFVF